VLFNAKNIFTIISNLLMVSFKMSINLLDTMFWPETLSPHRRYFGLGGKSKYYAEQKALITQLIVKMKHMRHASNFALPINLL